jgi:hypothetical protein
MVITATRPLPWPEAVALPPITAATWRQPEQHWRCPGAAVQPARPPQMPPARRLTLRHGAPHPYAPDPPDCGRQFGGFGQVRAARAWVICARLGYPGVGRSYFHLLPGLLGLLARWCRFVDRRSSRRDCAQARGMTPLERRIPGPGRERTGLRSHLRRDAGSRNVGCEEGRW